MGRVLIDGGLILTMDPERRMIQNGAILIEGAGFTTSRLNPRISMRPWRCSRRREFSLYRGFPSKRPTDGSLFSLPSRRQVS